MALAISCDLADHRTRHDQTKSVPRIQINQRSFSASQVHTIKQGVNCKKPPHLWLGLLTFGSYKSGGLSDRNRITVTTRLVGAQVTYSLL